MTEHKEVEPVEESSLYGLLGAVDRAIRKLKLPKDTTIADVINHCLDAKAALQNAEYELLKADAARWRFYCCNQTAMMLGSNLDPHDHSIDWVKECNRLADEIIGLQNE